MGNDTLRTLALIALLTLTACGGGSTPPPWPGRLPPSSDWTAYGSGSGIVARLPNPFTFPSQGYSINYVYTLTSGLAVGKTIALDYTIVGDGVFGEADSKDILPATVRLFIWGSQADFNNDRWWCPKPLNLALGVGRLSCVIDQSWTGVGGQAVNPAFNAAIAAPFAAGFTFGGQYFFGHGVFTSSGSMRFFVNNWSVQ